MIFPNENDTVHSEIGGISTNEYPTVSHGRTNSGRAY